MDTLKVSRPAVQVIAYWIKNENESYQGLNWKYKSWTVRFYLRRLVLNGDFEWGHVGHDQVKKWSFKELWKLI